MPGYEAPVYLAWSRRNRSALIRVPLYHPGKEGGDSAELRCPDPACNPYLCFAGMLQAGLEGIEKGYELPEPMEQNLYHLSPRSSPTRGSSSCPGRWARRSRSRPSRSWSCGPSASRRFRRFVEIKRKEWEDYRVQVTPYEIEQFLPDLCSLGGRRAVGGTLAMVAGFFAGRGSGSR